MVRFSKYLKGYAGGDREGEEEKKKEAKASPPPGEETAPGEEKQRPAGVGFPKVPVGGEVRGEMDREVSVRIYEEAIQFIQRLMKKVSESGGKAVLPGEEALQIAERITERLALKDYTLMSQAAKSLEGNHLPAHSVNVCIYSVVLGLGLDYNKGKLTMLALSALLHDTGLMAMPEITEKEGKLTDEEYQRVKTHPTLGAEIVSQIEGISNQVSLPVIEQHHERKDGGGYPKGLAGEDIDQLAAIVGLVDIYEASTHPRTYSEKEVPHEAVREIVKTNNDLFGDDLIRLLIEELSIYPVGSMVRLNTGAIARVRAVSRGYPLRPKVEVIFGSDGQREEKLTAVDLRKEPRLHIVRPIDERDLKEQAEKS